MNRQKILFADDDPEIREVLRLLLAGEGYEVLEASSGEQALELLDDSTDLVILDVMMPGMGGLCRLRGDPQTVGGAGAVSHRQEPGLGQDAGLFCGRGRLPGKTLLLHRAHLPGEGHAAPVLRLWS